MPVYANLFENPVFGQIINAALKSVLFIVLGMVALYKLKVSQSVNDLVGKVLGAQYESR